MSVGKNKIKVRVTDLREAIVARRTKLEAEHKLALAKYEEGRKGLSERIAKELEDYAAKLRSGRVQPTERLNTWSGKTRIEVPLKTKGDLVKPKDANIKTLDRMIQTLDMAAEDTILISADDFATYLG